MAHNNVVGHFFLQPPRDYFSALSPYRLIALLPYRLIALSPYRASIDLKLDKTNQTLSSLSATASSVADGIALLSIMASNQLTALEEIRDNTAKLNSMDRTLRTMQTSLMTLTGE